MTQDVRAEVAETLFTGGGEMGALMRSLDWSQTSLGSVDSWSQSLKTAVRIMLTSRQPMFVWWGEDLINLYNDAYRAILGGKHPAALGQPAACVWREIWDQVSPRAASAMLKNEGTYDEALLLLMERNGYPEETYYTFSYSPVPDDQGHTGGIICANTDDTQRIIGERQLALLRELAARTVDARTFDQACTLSADCLGTNPYDFPFAMIYLVDPGSQWAGLAGTSGIERGHPLAPEIVAIDDDSVWSFAEVVKSHQTCVIAGLDGQFKHLPTGAWQRSPSQGVAVPIAPSGQTGKAGILVAGLNPFRLFDDSYRGFIDLVAAQISASIANAQAYEEERKRAETLVELDRAKTAFFSNVSHEFRTPLTLMLSPLEELANTLDERLQPDERQQLQMVQRNGLRLQKLVNTLLDFSRIEAGRVQASYELTDLATYTVELASVFRSLIEQAGMELVIDCPALPEQVYVDREMWEKIVLNLISNAFKFTLAGRITVRLQPVGNSVELSVIDTGVGIPDAELPRLFERFHRVSGTRARTYEGSGIGLALVQELVKLHGGTIRVTSQLDHGTTFTIALPVGSAHLPGDRIGAPRTLTTTATGAMPYVEEALRWLPAENSKFSVLSSEFNSASLTQPSTLNPQIPQTVQILLVDDNTDMRDYVKRLLTNQGYTVDTAMDGRAALTAVRQQVPDLVLTDVMMPHLDGFGLLRELRSDPITRDVPIILLSARAGEEARIEGLAAGADDYLIKPFSARELVVRVEATLKLAQLRREAMQQEQALRLEAETAKQQVETILSSIHDGFYVLDRDWRFTYVNDRLCEIIAMERDQILGHSIWDLFPDVVNTDLYMQFHQVLNEQMPIQAEYFYSTWNRWYDHRIYPSPNGLTVFGTDITEAKRDEIIRNQANERLHLLYETTRDLLATAQPMQLMNNLFSKLSDPLELHYYYNYMVEDKDNRPMLHLRNYGGISDDAAQSIAWIEFSQYLCGLVAQERRQIALDRAQISTHPNAQLIDSIGITAYAGQPLIVKGKLLGTLSFASCTRTCFTPEDLDLLQSTCEQIAIAIERANLIASIQQQAEQLQQANRIKDEFLAVLSHELRSPLNPIVGWSKLLRSQKLDEAKTNYALEVIERNAKMQAQLINDLLDVSRILQGKISLNVSSVDLVATIQAAMETVRLAAETKSIQLHTQFEPNVGLISGDAGRLQQVVWNLLSNAVKFTPEGGQIEVRLERLGSEEGAVASREWGRRSGEIPNGSRLPTPPSPTYAQITVKDTGKGILSAFLPHVFEYFRQADATTTRKFGGLGLGLAIVHYLVELHGGTVEADSPGENQGATFTVKLPLMPHQPALSLDTSPLQKPLDLKGIRVLVVDDDDSTREFVAFLLELHGAEVTAVASASKALTVFSQVKPDILLSDIGMPEMDGYTLMRQVRTLSTQQGGQIPAIALTAYAGEIDHQRAIAAGFQTHISKPVEPDMLVEAIVGLVGQRP